MALDIKKFVDVNITQHIDATVSGTRPCVALYTTEGTAGTTHTVSSLAEANTQYPVGTFPKTNNYLVKFFNNGGVQCKVIEGVDYEDLTASDIKSLGNDIICVNFVMDGTSRATLTVDSAHIVALIRAYNSDSSVYGINEKLFFTVTSFEEGGITGTIKNSVFVYTTPTALAVGSEMVFSAYLSQIDVYGVDTVKDIMFTPVNLTGEDITDTVYSTIIANDVNVVSTLAGSPRILGGNCKDGTEIVNEYVRIVLHQTLTSVLTTLLVSKIKGQTGVSQIYATITKELQNYITDGYLTNGKIWDDVDYTVTRGETTYTLISNGTPINYFYISVLPFEALTTAEQTAHSAPPIYVFIADQYGIRKITINGEVI